MTKRGSVYLERRGIHAQDLPAEEAAPPESARFPQAHGHQQRPQGAFAPQGEGKGAPVVLNGRADLTREKLGAAGSGLSLSAALPFCFFPSFFSVDRLYL